jgi:hypothetical protein
MDDGERLDVGRAQRVLHRGEVGRLGPRALDHRVGQMRRGGHRRDALL